MLSFHNDQAVKDKYLSRIKKHRELDNIIQGTGWDDGRGCAVGCTLEAYDHNRYPIELGLPEWIAHLEDTIFENLSTEEAKLWPERFLDAIPVGVDIELIKHKLAIKRMDRLIILQSDILNRNPDLEKVFTQVIEAINIVKICHEAELNKLFCDWSAARSAAWSAWSAAESATRSAAWSAWSAARSAAESAESATRSAAWSAWSAAESAARSAESAAWSAARLAAWKQEANDLIELLQQLKE